MRRMSPSPFLTGGTVTAVYGLLAVALLAAIVYLVRTDDVSVWYVVVFAVAPDMALLAGMSPGLERGQLHPRAVPLYNLLHHPGGPLLLAMAALPWLGPSWPVTACAWGLHIAIDRAVGYGPRNAEGFQRA